MLDFVLKVLFGLFFFIFILFREVGIIFGFILYLGKLRFRGIKLYVFGDIIRKWWVVLVWRVNVGVAIFSFRIYVSYLGCCRNVDFELVFLG